MTFLKNTRNVLLAGAVALAPMIGSAAIVPAAATSDPVITTTLPAEYDQNRDGPAPEWGVMDIVPPPATISPADLTRPAPVAVPISAQIGAETPDPDSGTIEYRDEHGNLVEPVHTEGGFDRSHLARVDDGDEAPLPAEVDADGDGFVDIMPFDEGATAVPISAEIPTHADRSWIPGLIGGAAAGSLATFLVMRRQGLRAGVVTA